MIKNTLAVGIVVLLALAGCNNKEGSGKASDLLDSNSPSCKEVLAPAVAGNGCEIHLVTPKNCEEIDFSEGKTYEFAWQVTGWCETPYKLCVAGNPANAETGENVLCYSFSTVTGQITNKGGYVNASLADLGDLKSDGIYHWTVIGYHGSHPASQTFRVRR